MQAFQLHMQREIDALRTRLPTKLRATTSAHSDRAPVHLLTDSRAAAAHALVLKIPAPTQHLLANQVDPFDTTFYHSQSTYESANTQTVPVKISFTAFAGVNGICNVVHTPNNLGREAARYTLATADPGNKFAIPSATNNHAFVKMTKPYDSSMGNTNGTTELNIKSRLVSAGIRIKHVGPTDVRSGSIKIVTTLDNRNITNQDISEFELTGTVRNEPVTSNWTMASWRPRNDSQKKLLQNNDTLPYSTGTVPGYPSCASTVLYYEGVTAAGNGGGPAYGIHVTGCYPGITFLVEIIEHWEYSGHEVGLLAKPIIADPVGVARVDSILHEAEQAHISDPTKNKIIHTAEAVEKIAFALEPVAAAGATAIFGPAGGEAVHIATDVVKKLQKPLNDVIGSLGSAFSHLF